MIPCEHLHVKLEIQPCGRVPACLPCIRLYIQSLSLSVDKTTWKSGKWWTYILLWSSGCCPHSEHWVPHSAQSSLHTDIEGQLQVSFCLSFYGENSSHYQSLSKLKMKTKPKRSSDCACACAADVWYLSDSFRHLNIGSNGIIHKLASCFCKGLGSKCVQYGVISVV